MLNLKFIGGMFIVTGTCIGGGLLALPVSASMSGFVNSVLIMFFIWIVMLMGSLYILEMTQWFSNGTNIISISRNVLGRKGEFVVWFVYVILCYSLICAYIAGSGSIFYRALTVLGINVSSPSLTTIIFTLGLATVVYKGVRSIDNWNRLFMIFQFISLFLLIFLISPHIKVANLFISENRSIGIFASIAVTSFGYSIVIPSLFDYFQGNVKKVRLIIFWGSLIPLFCYVLWMFVITGALSHGALQAIFQSGDATVGLVDSLKLSLNINSVTKLANIFIPLCILTSVLGVSLALSDLFVDGLKLKRGRVGKLKMCCITFIPPLLIVIFFPKIFIIALSYAGLLVIVQQLILPVIIIWHGRYRKKISKNYKVFGGKILLLVMFIVT